MLMDSQSINELCAVISNHIIAKIFFYSYTHGEIMMRSYESMKRNFSHRDEYQKNKNPLLIN